MFLLNIVICSLTNNNSILFSNRLTEYDSIKCQIIEWTEIEGLRKLTHCMICKIRMEADPSGSVALSNFCFPWNWDAVNEISCTISCQVAARDA